MNQERFGKIIKEIRKKNNLTQKQFADKYNVTYQAVSKWENGLNMPDTFLIKQISDDFDISLDELFDCETKKEKKKKSTLILIILLFVLVFIIIILLIKFKNNNSDFMFKTLSSNCDNFSIFGNIAYNDKKTSIYISNIEYCGEIEDITYKKFECILYESNNNIDKKISSFSYDDTNGISLEEFLNKVTLSVDDYKMTCDDYLENSLFLTINARNDSKKITSYVIPLLMEKNCPN